jgi:hypothetical protein
MSSFALFLHQARFPQQAQVFRDGRPRHREQRGDRPGRLAASRAQQIQHRAAGWIGQRLEGRFP